jgi:septal ring factor EnvC (AmiA/AmiB activator)
MKEEILKVIERNLPKQMSDVLLSRFKELERKEEENERLNKRIVAYENELKELQTEINSYKKELEAYKDLEKREKVLAKKEYEYELFVTKERLKALEMAKIEIKDLVTIIFKNKELVKNANLWGSFNFPNQYGGEDTHTLNLSGEVKEVPE